MCASTSCTRVHKMGANRYGGDALLKVLLEGLQGPPSFSVSWTDVSLVAGPLRRRGRPPAGRYSQYTRGFEPSIKSTQVDAGSRQCRSGSQCLATMEGCFGETLSHTSKTQERTDRPHEEVSNAMAIMHWPSPQGLWRRPSSSSQARIHAEPIPRFLLFDLSVSSIKTASTASRSWSLK